MGSAGVLGLLVLLVASGSAYYLESNDTSEISWPTEYNFKAEKIDVVSGEVETYEVCTRKYYVAETDDDPGYVYVIYPTTNKDLGTETECSKRRYSGGIKDFMPPTEEYELSGEITLDGRPVKVWKKEGEEQGLKFEASLYVYRTDYNFDVPVKKTLKAYELSKGSIESFIITNYNSFGFTITEDDVTISKEEVCLVSGTMGDDLKTDLKFLHPDLEGDLDTAFHSYKRQHNKNYDGDEHELRKSIFHKNWRYVEAHNRKNLTYKLELNHFADMTDEEFSLRAGTRPSDPDAEGSIPFPHSEEELKALEDDLPEEYDMRLEGYLRPIRNQGACGSCWAFSTTAAVEGALSRVNGRRNLDLSEQSLVDCAWGYENFGCSGGQLDKAFEYILTNKIPTERQYGKYLELEGTCHLANTTEKFGIRGFSKVTSGSALAMKTALYKYGPVTAAIYASDTLKLYSSGILYDFECEGVENPNHGVVVVGYGVRDGTLYWIVRNSWGESWGEDGYFLISSVNDNCLVLDSSYYPVA